MLVFEVFEFIYKQQRAVCNDKILKRNRNVMGTLEICNEIQRVKPKNILLSRFGTFYFSVIKKNYTLN